MSYLFFVVGLVLILLQAGTCGSSVPTGNFQSGLSRFSFSNSEIKAETRRLLSRFPSPAL
jgi:hypothetical protein